MFRFSSIRSTRHIAHAHHKPVEHQQPTVFQMNPPCGEVTLEDVDDLYPICNAIPDPKLRYACYACYGMDMEKVEKYYHIVSRLEEEYRKACQEEKRTRSYHVQALFWHIFLNL